MNTHDAPPKYTMAVCKGQYRGFDLYQTGEGVVILIGHEWKLFGSLEAARAFIDTALSKVVTN